MKIKFDFRRLLYSRLSRKARLMLLLCLMSCTTVLYASPGVMEQASMQQTSQQKTILVNGIVTDAQGEPLIGVNVIVKGAAGGTITDIDGKFSVKVPNENSTLQFSYIGFKAKSRVVGKDRILKITLEADNKMMEEVVVVGYGTAKRKDLTGAVGRVDVEELQKAPVKSLDEALAGRVAGVQVISGDGQPGSNAEIVIRGVGSVTQSTAPLYVVDGFPLEEANFNSINPNDIESIDVLKDASSTAIYGARGSNGVVLITTKRGKSEKPTITYNGYYGAQKPVKTMELLDAYEFVRLQNDVTPGYATGTYLTTGSGLNVKDLTFENYKNVAGIDWQKLCTRNAPAFQNHSISLSAKTNKTAYTVSASYTGQEGLVIQSGFDRYQGRFTLDQDITDKLKVGINVNYSNATTTGIAGNSQFGGSAYFSFMTNLWTYRPVLGAEMSTEDYDSYLNTLADSEDQTRINPYLSTINTDNSSVNKVFTPNGYLQYKLTKDLMFKSTFGQTVNTNEAYNFNNSSSANGNPYSGFGRVYGVNGSRSNSQTTSTLNENTLTYNKKFNKNNVLNALVGFTSQEYKLTSSGFAATNLTSESLGINGLYLGTPYSVASYASSNRMESFLGRVNYTLMDKYLFTASMRADGSSKFAPGNRWGYFPSGAFAWRINQEKFLKNVKDLDNAKLRISFGATGNNRVDDYAYLSKLTSSTSSNLVSFNEANTAALYLSQMGNKALKWETGIQTDIGLDVSLFKSRLNIELDYYNRETKDLLLNATMPYYSGVSSALKNVGKVSNSGIELSINTVNFSNKTFKWTSNFNITFNRNRLKALNSGETELLTYKNFYGSNTVSYPAYIGKVGSPVAMFYGYICEGNYQLSDFYRVQNGGSGYTYVLKEGLPYYGTKQTINSINSNPAQNCIQPGDVKFKDLNGDGYIDQNDMTTIGSPYPVHFGGLTNTFSYKGFDLSVFLQWSYGNDIINANRLIMEGSLNTPSTNTTGYVGMIRYNQYATYANRWTYTNPSNLYPRVDAHAGGSRAWSTRLIEDGSYLRLKTLQLAYNVPVKLVKKVGISNARFYISGQNLLTITGYSGIDPEVSTASGSNLTPGFDFSPYPRTKVLTLGTTITL
ncbi:SusC/RagA family TonB-linked outer membrane protein [Parabacteroides sp. FAFU027]|uniref:SusC/RagA family TonB-linked outer membrane protein n=1 Tax=Parabacteroides sp. FAFU027 TaxID=2922715 RepID=UPI001FAF575C|nr:TonB-dependent receptor [Parabacteroides sp. FAFU027]